MALDAEIKRKKVMGELVTHEKGKIKLCDFWDVYVKNYTAAVTPRTFDSYRRLWSKHIEPALGDTAVRSLDRESVAALSATLSAKLSPATVRKCLAVLHSVLARAVEWGYISTNPATGVRKPRLVQRTGTALNSDQLSALCAELDKRSAVIARVLTGSGLRPGELRALTWGDVRDDGSIVVSKAASNDVVGPTKTGGVRAVSPTEDARTALKEWFLAQGRPAGRSLVFPSPQSGLLWTDNGYRLWAKKVFRPAANRAGLKGLRPYDLRHTFASQRIAEGADILSLAAQLGHSPTMTLTVYGHLLASARPGSTEALAQASDVAVS